MSIEYLNAVFKTSKTKAAARLILLSLADTASDEGTCFPSVKTLSRKSGVSLQVTREYLKAFEVIGLVSILHRAKDDGKQTSNMYQIDYRVIGNENITTEIIRSVRCASRLARVKHGLLGSNTGDHTPSNTGDHTPSNTGDHEPSINRHINHLAKAVKNPKEEKQIPPSVEAYRQGAGVYPPKHLWQFMDDAIGTEEKSVTLWGKVVLGYVLMGYNKLNISNMFEFYKRGEIPVPKKFDNQPEYKDGVNIIRPPQPRVIRQPR